MEDFFVKYYIVVVFVVLTKIYLFFPKYIYNKLFLMLTKIIKN